MFTLEGLFIKTHEERQIWICFSHYQRISEKYIPKKVLMNRFVIKQISLLNQPILTKR